VPTLKLKSQKPDKDLSSLQASGEYLTKTCPHQALGQQYSQITCIKQVRNHKLVKINKKIKKIIPEVEYQLPQ
jgi:hypothetical protein